MSEIILQNGNLPSKMEDLSRFVLIGREKLTAVRAEIRAIDKVGLAEEVRQQKLQEAQQLGEAVLDAEVRIGELMAKVPKATPNNNPFHENTCSDNLVKPKKKVIEEAGFTPTQASHFQQMASHPDVVEAAKAEARENDEVVTRSKVLSMIKQSRL